jgi:hypothetical protein
MQARDDGIEEIQIEVLAYLDDHPGAADSADAIQQWWLLERMAILSRTKVQNALDQLVADNRVEQRVLRDGRKIYARLPTSQTLN